MKKELNDHQLKPRPFGMKARRLNAVTRILLAIFAMMLFPQSTWAQVDYYVYNTTSGAFDKMTLQADKVKSLPASTNNGPDFGVLTISPGTYVVSSGNPVSYPLDHVIISGKVNIILCDGATWNAPYGIEVPQDAVLNIYGQEQGTGVLNAKGAYDSFTNTYYAAIGSSNSFMNSRGLNRAPSDPQINIHGGQITANSGQTDYSAGIGGGYGSFDGSVTIYGGKVTAIGGHGGAGIGGGFGSVGSTVSIYGGEVIATGGDGNINNVGHTAAMGIGGGSNASDNGKLEIFDDVTCYGNSTSSSGSLDANPVNGYNDNVGARYRYMRTVRSYDLWVGTTQVAADNASAILKTASFYPTSNTLKLERLNANINIQTGIADFTVLFNDVNKLGGVATATAGSGGCIQYTGTGNGKLTLTALPLANGDPSTLTINNPGDAPIKGFSTINFNETYIESALPIYFDATDKRYEDKTDVVVSTLKITTDPKYLLWIGGNDSEIIQVTAGSLDINSTIAIQGGSVEYLELLNTFQLVDATINGNIESAMGDLIIEILGSNTINHSTSAASPIVSYNGGDLIMASDGGTGVLELAGAGQSYTTDPISGFSTIDYLSELTLGKNESKNYVVRKPTPYDLKVNGTQVDNNNSWNVLGTLNSKGDPMVVFETDGTTNTLTLDGLKADFNQPIISQLSNLTIVFKGTNTVDASKKGANGFIQSTRADGGDLTFKGDLTGNPAGTPSTLFLSSSNKSTIQGFANVTYDNAYLSSDVACAYVTGNSNVPSLVDAVGEVVDNVTITTVEHYPLWVNDKQVNESNKTNVLSDASTPYKAVFTSESGVNTLALTGAEINNNKCAIESNLGNLTISLKGANKVVNTNTNGRSALFSLNSNAALTIENGGSATDQVSLLVKSDPNASPAAIEGFKSLTSTGFTPFSVDASDNPVSDISSTLSYSGNALTSSGDNLSSVYLTNVVDYGLTVEGTPVTSLNAGDIKGNSKVVYDQSSKTLTLKDGASLSIKDNAPAISLGSGLTSLKIELEGYAEILDGTSSNATNDAIVSTATGAKPTVTFAVSAKTPSSAIPILKIQTDNSAAFFNNITASYADGLVYWDMNTNGYTYQECIIRKSPWNGSGTTGDPYQIKITDDLVALSTFVNSGYIINQNFELATDDLDFGPVSFTSIGKRISNNQIYSFDGVFNGGGKTIKNLTSPYGLFTIFGFNNHSTNPSTITGLKLSNCKVTGVGTDTDCVGGIVAEMFGNSQIVDCEVTGGSVTGGTNSKIGFVGGIVGCLRGGTVSGCTVGNVDISLPDAQRTFRQGVGGIVGALEGTVSGCKVTASTNGSNMTISNATSTNQTLYTGAIVGEIAIGAVLKKNTYDAGIIVVENSNTKSGNNQRGTGIDDGNGNFDVFNNNGAVLSGLQTIDVTVGANGTVEYLEGCYRYDQQNKKLYALPYSISTQKTKIKATSSLGYDQPTISLALNGGSYNLANTTAGTDNTGAANATWEFEMPEDDLTATIAFPLDFSNGNRTFAISNPANAKKVYDGNQISITEIKTTFNNNELTLNAGRDFKITQYKDKNNANSTSTSAPTEAGSYEATIVPGTTTGITGSATVDFTITQADGTVKVSELTQEVTYDGNSHALSGVSATGGTAVVTYYNNEADRTAGTGGFTQAPTDAHKYYVRVTQGNANYASPNVDATFTIKPKGIDDANSISVTVNGTYTYNGQEVKPASTDIVVTDGGKPLVYNDDYTISYNNNKDAGTEAEVIITGKGNYDSKTQYVQKFTIGAKSITTVGIQVNGTYTYDGSAITPNLSVTDGGSDILPANYSVKYQQNDNGTLTDVTEMKNAGSYKIVVTGKANYKDEKSIDFSIGKADITNATTFGAIDDKNYSGLEIKPTPTVSVTLGGNTVPLREGTEFTYSSYANNVNAASKNDASAPTVTIQGIGNFTGSASTKFTILPANIATMVVDINGWTYGQPANKPSVPATSNPGGADADKITYVYKQKDQDDSYYKNVVPSDADTYIVRATVPATQNYKEASGTKEFTISPAEMNTASITAIAEDALTYDRTAQEPKPAVTFNGKQLTENQDFTYSWSNNTNAGKSSDASAPQVTITGKGNFKNTNTLKFTINPASITSVEVSGTNFSYVPGETKQMTITKVMAGTLVLDQTEYSVSGDKAIAVGDYVLTVTGTGNFKDSKTVDWHILERKANVSFGTKKYITFYDAAETFLVPDDVTAYIVTNVSGNTVVVKEVSFIKKSVPVLLESTPGKKTVDDKNQSFAGNRLKYGTGAAGPYDYVLYNNEFVKATGSVNGKVYLDAQGLVSNARTLTIVRDDDATTIDALFSEEDGEDQWFDLQGRKINKPTKAGLYIRNGKKVVIKNK